MLDMPTTFEIKLPGAMMSCFDDHIERRLSSMKGIFLDGQAFQQMQDQDDLLMYEVYGMRRPELPGELLNGISIVHPGKVGNEFFMTKGHFHNVLETGETYYCIQGSGCMVMETPEGDWSVEELWPGKVLYVPPRWAHRSVNTSLNTDLATFYVCPGHSGHDYGTIERQGFRKIVVSDGMGVKVIDNPRWCAPGDRV